MNTSTSIRAQRMSTWLMILKVTGVLLFQFIMSPDLVSTSQESSSASTFPRIAKLLALTTGLTEQPNQRGSSPKDDTVRSTAPYAWFRRQHCITCLKWTIECMMYRSRSPQSKLRSVGARRISHTMICCSCWSQYGIQQSWVVWPCWIPRSWRSAWAPRPEVSSQGPVDEL